jgi:hypothetical protein
LSEALMHANPGKAAEFAESLEPGDQRDQILNQIARAWALKDAATALNWASERRDTDERERLLDVIRSEREKRDGPDAPESVVVDDLATAVKQFAWDKSQASAVETLTQKWAAKNLSAALEWVEQVPEGGMRDSLLLRIALVQAETAPAEAACLVVGQIPPGPRQTEAVISIVHRWGLQGFDGAVAWVNRFPDGELKTRAQRELDGIVQYQHRVP